MLLRSIQPDFLLKSNPPIMELDKFITCSGSIERGVYLTNVVLLPINKETLTLLNLKPTLLVTTVGKDGSTNAAPYSWFTIADYDPPRFLLSTNMKRHTYRNILETGELVANFPDTSLLREIWVTSKHFPYGVNELEKAGLTGIPSEKVKPPRIKECRAHIECKVLWVKPIGSASLVLGEIVSISAQKEIEHLTTRNKMVKLNPPLYFSFKEKEGAREWMFAEIGKIATITEKDEQVKIKSENL